MITPPPIPPGNTHRGYNSEASKRKFTMAIGIISAIAFIAQFVVPMVVWMTAMPFFMMNQVGNMSIVAPDAVAVWQDAVWYVEDSTNLRGGPSSDKLKMIRDGDENPTNVVEVSLSSPKLLADKDRLWLISSDKTACYKDGSISYALHGDCLLYTSPSPRDGLLSRMPSSA